MADKTPQVSYQDIIREEYKKCMESPVYFMRHYIKIQHPVRGTILFDLYPFQEATLQDFHDYQFNIILKSRQMGISTLVAAYCLWLMIFNKDKNILIISLRQDEAKELVAKVRYANEKLPTWLKVKCIEDNRLSLKFANGSQIKATSTTKKSGVSLALSLLIIDEAALIEEAEDLWTSAQPTLSCIDKTHLILTNKGLVRLESLITSETKLGFNDLCINIHDGDTLSKSTSFYKSDISDLYEITLKSGAKLVATKQHPFMTKNGWKTVETLIKNKDAVLCKYCQNLYGNDIDFSYFNPTFHGNTIQLKIGENDACYLAGLWTAEGHFNGNNVGITNTDEEIINLLTRLGFKHSDERHYYLNSKWMVELLKWIGCGGTAHDKRVPRRILSGSEKNQIQFLRGLFDGDGCSLKNKGVKLTSISFELLSDVRCMLLNMGINSYIRPVTWKSTKSTVIKDKTRIFHGFELFIGGYDAHSFYATIGFGLQRKQMGWGNLSLKSIKRVYPDKQIIKNLILETGLSIRKFSQKYKHYYDRYLWYGGKGLSIRAVECLLDVCNSLHPSENWLTLKKQYNKDTSEFYDEVISVKFLKRDFSYDIKVPSTERFLANGYVSHNTGGNAIVLSTPRGVGNWFHQMWVGAEENNDGRVGKNGFHPIKLMWQLHPERNEEWRRIEGEKIGNPKKASQEYDCNFLASGDNVVDLIIIEFYKKTHMKDPYDVRGADRGLWVWEYPADNHIYLVAADVARGDGMDYSAAQVLDISSPLVTQAAEYKGSFGTRDFANFLYGLASEYNSALLVVERESVGWSTITEIIRREYKNLFYSSADLKYVDVQRQLTNKIDSEEKKLVPGFSTNIKTRPLVISNMELYFREKGVLIYSKRTLGELETFIWKNGKAQAMSEKYNDDLVMSLGIGLWVRDTALRLRQEGIELTRATLDQINKTKMDQTPIYKQKQIQVGANAWKMNTGRQGFGNQNQEDIRWLLS